MCVCVCPEQQDVTLFGLRRVCVCVFLLHTEDQNTDSSTKVRTRWRLSPLQACGRGQMGVSGVTHLPPALVSLAASGLGTFGLTQVFFMTGHQLPVPATPARLLHHLRGQGGGGECV